MTTERPTLPPITIATRESRLALWQAEHVQALLRARGHSVELLGMTTLGDQILDRSLSKVGGKGLFVKELETKVTLIKPASRAWPDGERDSSRQTRPSPA